MGNALMIALGKMKPKGDMPKDESSERDLEEGEDDIALDEEEMAAARAAFNAKDEEEYGKALKAFVHLCSMKSKDDEEDGY